MIKVDWVFEQQCSSRVYCDELNFQTLALPLPIVSKASLKGITNLAPNDQSYSKIVSSKKFNLASNGFPISFPNYTVHIVTDLVLCSVNFGMFKNMLGK